MRVADRLLSLALPAVLLGQCATECAPAPPAPDASGWRTLVVGRDIQPGTYWTRTDPRCEWNRLSGPMRTPEALIAVGSAAGLHLVTIEATDVAFAYIAPCGTWTPYIGAADRVDRLTVGDWHVGQHVEPGRWRTDASTQACAWQRASGFTHEPDEVIEHGSSTRTQVVVIASTDVRFSVGRNCGAWTRES
jgi:hypothetical protein